MPIPVLRVTCSESSFRWMHVLTLPGKCLKLDEVFPDSLIGALMLGRLFDLCKLLYRDRGSGLQQIFSAHASCIQADISHPCTTCLAALVCQKHLEDLTSLRAEDLFSQRKYVLPNIIERNHHNLRILKEDNRNTCLQVMLPQGSSRLPEKQPSPGVARI